MSILQLECVLIFISIPRWRKTFFFSILRRMGKNKALAHHTSTYFHTLLVRLTTCERLGPEPAGEITVAFQSRQCFCRSEKFIDLPWRRCSYHSLLSRTILSVFGSFAFLSRHLAYRAVVANMGLRPPSFVLKRHSRGAGYAMVWSVTV